MKKKRRGEGPFLLLTAGMTFPNYSHVISRGNQKISVGCSGKILAVSASLRMSRSVRMEDRRARCLRPAWEDLAEESEKTE